MLTGRLTGGLTGLYRRAYGRLMELTVGLTELTGGLPGLMGGLTDGAVIPSADRTTMSMTDP